MSFRCEKCHKAQPPHSSPNFVVTKRREKMYTNETGETTGKGWEIVEGIKICKKCDKEMKKKAEEEKR